MKNVKVIVLRTAGTNCDMETAFAFRAAGAQCAELVHVNSLTRAEKALDNYHILAIPGGFTYGDDIGSGKILANELKFNVGDALGRFIKSGRLVIGICNGFQVLVKAGLLPNLSADGNSIEATLTLNDSDRFEDRWVYLKRVQGTGYRVQGKCVWTRGIGDLIQLPVAHGEGKFIPKDRDTLRQLKAKGLVVFEYADENGKRKGYPYNPNGSVENIAGICDTTGRVFGLMPHPERHITFYQHPRWTRLEKKVKGHGIRIFENGVNFAKKYL